MLRCTNIQGFLSFSMTYWMFFMVTVGFAAYVDKCKYCSLVVETFKAGMKKTENQHFAGGNTDWEERKLGKFSKSETRLVEVMEHLCKTKYLDDSDEFRNVKDVEFKCQQLVEEHEESIENWYFHKQFSNPDFLKWLCHEKLRLCCDKGHFGTDCKPCPGIDKGLPACSGHGSCQGDGSREGSGKCKCDMGYVGFMCSNCDANYYAMRNSSTFVCSECHKSCKGGCSGSGPRDCKECHVGWIMNDSNECEDVNECFDEDRCTGEHVKCNNTEGSYECICEKGFVKGSNGVCEVDIEAPPEKLWVRPDRLLHSFSIAGLCLLVSVVIWQRSFSLFVFAAVCALTALFIEFYFDHSSLSEFSHFPL
ncbi:latent transforming growth factor beta binding protein 4 [Loa loa]|uniref:Latent transforming growth factor beta binding protein 4 n=1 Tax=Loa loa TaxID=7209 RepID=A0A1S0UJE3_LOALO|nr:latent transforming growth factor beta binding protein 4 [Loa loa]EJD75709.1 latent transforming growth factor beta binding protein 4 [Loa loa]